MSNILNGLEYTIVKGSERIFRLDTLGIEYLLMHVEYITPEDEALKEARIKQAKLKLFASLLTSLVFILSAVSTLIEIPLLTLIKKQTIKLITHNRFIISK